MSTLQSMMGIKKSDTANPADDEMLKRIANLKKSDGRSKMMSGLAEEDLAGHRSEISVGAKSNIGVGVPTEQSVKTENSTTGSTTETSTTAKPKKPGFSLKTLI